MPELHQIKASAGSGKTYALTRNYIARLRSCGERGQASACLLSQAGLSCAAAEILAVTFTNAAATEMRERIIRRLKECALDQAADAAERGMAAKWLNALLRDMSSLNIRTIDSLLHLIVRSSALDLGLNPDFEPVFASEDAIAPILELFLAEAAQDGEQRDLLEKAWRAIHDFSQNKGFLSGKKLSSRVRDVLPDVLRRKFNDLTPIEEIQKKHAEIKDAAMGAATAFLQTAAEESLAWKKPALQVVENYASGNFPDRLSAYVNKSGAGELFLKNTVISERAQKAFQDFASQSRRFHVLEPAMAQARLLYPFIELARRMASSFLDRRRDEGIVPNIQIPMLAGQALNSDNGVSDALCRLGSRLTHFLIDEFQDTSREQWHALRPLVLEALSRGGSMTWVGDVKQSIYGWREGDPALFDEISRDCDLRAIALAVNAEKLEVNWRSQKTIVEHANALFARAGDMEFARKLLAELLPKDTPPEILRNAALELSSAYGGAIQKFRPDQDFCGLVQSENITGATEDEISEKILERLADLLKNDIGPRRRWSDVLVLVRSNGNAALAAEKLIHAGIPVVTENSLLLADHPLIAQTIALLAFLDIPENDIAFWTVVTGSIFMEHPLAGGLDWNRLNSWAAGIGKRPLFTRFAADFPEVWQNILAPFHGQATLMTPYDIVMEWYSRLDVEKRFSEEQTFLRRFMEVLQHSEEKGFGSIAAFLEYWSKNGVDEKAPMPERMNAARIMTIHKAKGLEAPVAVIPWSNFPVKPPGRPTAMEIDGMRLPVNLNSKAAGALYYEELAKQAIEALNLFYVAVTRPREELYIFRPLKEGKKTSGARNLNAALDILSAEAGLKSPYKLGEVPRRAPEVPPDVQTMPVRESCGETPLTAIEVDSQAEGYGWRPMRWLPRLKIFRNHLDSRALTAEERGIFLHYCLEHLQFCGNPAEEAAAAFSLGLSQSGIYVPEDEALRQGLISAIQWFAGLEQSASWLRRGWPEHSLVDSEGRLLRPDLLVPEPWGALVIDYKSGQPNEKNMRQIRRYLACLESSEQFSGKYRGILVYLDQKKFQMVTKDRATALEDECPDPELD